MNNTTIINIFNSDNNNITNIKTWHGQIIKTIVYIILKFKSLIKKPIVTNHVLFDGVTFSNNWFLCLYQFYRNTAFLISNLDFHQSNQSFAYLQFYKHSFLNIRGGNSYLPYSSKESIKWQEKIYILYCLLSYLSHDS